MLFSFSLGDEAVVLCEGSGVLELEMRVEPERC